MLQVDAISGQQGRPLSRQQLTPEIARCDWWVGHLRKLHAEGRRRLCSLVAAVRRMHIRSVPQAPVRGGVYTTHSHCGSIIWKECTLADFSPPGGAFAERRVRCTSPGIGGRADTTILGATLQVLQESGDDSSFRSGTLQSPAKISWKTYADHSAAVSGVSALHTSRWRTLLVLQNFVNLRALRIAELTWRWVGGRR